MSARAAVLAIALCAGCYEPPVGAACGIACDDDCPGDLACVNNVCLPPGGAACTLPPPELVAVTVGARHACGLDVEGRIHCWGDNTAGQLGLGSGIARIDVPTLVGDAAARWSMVAAGGEHTCALQDGVPWCWGQNEDAQADGGAGGVVLEPRPVSFAAAPPLPSFDEIATGSQHTCAIGEGQLWCWGFRSWTGLDGAEPGVAARVGTLDDWTQLTAGGEHACAISASLGPMCWGNNNQGQLARPEDQTFLAPVAVAGLPPTLELRRLIAGSRVTCAIMATAGADPGELWCWGASNRRLDATTSAIRVPIRVGTASDWTTVSIGDPHMCGLRAGHAWCWGASEDDGLLGGGLWFQPEVLADTAIDAGPARAIALGPFAPRNRGRDDFACLIDGTTAACWGENSSGNLGIGGFARHDAATEVTAPQGQTWANVWAGRNHVCATTGDGALWCWGMDDHGQISAGVARGGDQPCVLGAPCDFPRPIRAPSQIGIPDELVTGYDFVCAREATTVRCWGRRYDGQLGVQNPTDSSVKTVLAPNGAWTRIVGGERATCGFTFAGSTEPVCWGRIATTEQVTPSPLPAEVTDVRDVSFGDQFACATRNTDDARLCWGQNQHGNLGDGTTVNGPTAIARDANMIDRVVANRDQACALLLDTSIQCWGDNTFAAVGQPGGDLLAPAKLTSAAAQPLTGCTDLGLADDHGCAVCGGVVSCWGRNDHGQLGRNTPTDRGDKAAAAPVVGLDGIAVTRVVTTDAGGCALGDDRLFCWGDGQHGEVGTGGQGRNLPTPVATAAPSP